MLTSLIPSQTENTGAPRSYSHLPAPFAGRLPFPYLPLCMKGMCNGVHEGSSVLQETSHP